MGKNLIPYPFSDTTKVNHGITFTDNGDGTITTNGVASYDASFDIFYYGRLTGVAAGDKVKLTGCPSGGSEDTYCITMQGATDIGSGVEFVVENWMVTDAGIELYIKIKTGTTMNNVVFKPRLEKITSVGDKLLEIAENQEKVYQAGKDFMVDETTIIEKTVTGVGSVTVNDVSEAKHEVGVKATNPTPKNYIDPSMIPDKDWQNDSARCGLMMKWEKGKIIFNGTSEYTCEEYPIQCFDKNIIDFFDLEPNTEYRLLGAPIKDNDESTHNACSLYIDFYRADEENGGRLRDRGYGTVFIPSDYEDCPEWHMWTYIMDGTVCDNLVFYPQIVKEEDYQKSLNKPTTLTVTGSTYTKTYPINSDGTVSDVYSQCPTMTFTTDSAQTNIEVKYHQSYGQKNEYDRFWDEFQLNGERHYYVQAFGGCWTSAIFKPKYDLAVTGSNGFGMFRACNLTGSLKQMLLDAGVSLTFDRCNNINSLFQEAYYITEIGELDFSTVTRKNCTQVFLSCQKLKTIDKIILPAGQTTFNQWFSNCKELTNVILEGEIAVSLSLADSPLLSDTSVESIIGCLKEIDEGETKPTLTVHATVGANMTEAQKAEIITKNWTLVY